MTGLIICSGGALIFGCFAGYLNSRITNAVLNGNVSTQKVMAVNVIHLLIAAVCLGLITLAVKLLHIDYTVPLLLGALGLVGVPILVSILRKVE